MTPTDEQIEAAARAMVNLDPFLMAISMENARMFARAALAAVPLRLCTRCIGCGKILPDGADIAAHVSQCAAHPLTIERAKTAALLAALKEVAPRWWLEQAQRMGADIRAAKAKAEGGEKT